jgi:transposase
VLGLDLTAPGFDPTVLSELRPRLVAGQAEQLLLDTLLTLARTQGLLTTRGRQRTDSTHVVAAIRVLHRLERVGETLRAALHSLAAGVPAWVQTLAPPEWYERYGHRVENYQRPKPATARKALAAVIGAEGPVLLQAIDAASEPQSRYIGLAKTPLHHIATAAALNMGRLGAWWAGTPHAKTRYAPFTRLKQSWEERMLNGVPY